MQTISTAGRSAATKRRIAMVSDDRLYQTMAAHARQLAPLHSWTTVADQYLEVTERLVMAPAVSR